jgi:hypothetical protein
VIPKAGVTDSGFSIQHEIRYTCIPGDESCRPTRFELVWAFPLATTVLPRLIHLFCLVMMSLLETDTTRWSAIWQSKTLEKGRAADIPVSTSLGSRLVEIDKDSRVP